MGVLIWCQQMECLTLGVSFLGMRCLDLFLCWQYGYLVGVAPYEV